MRYLLQIIGGRLGAHWVPDSKGDAVELVITDAEEASSSQVPITMYLGTERGRDLSIHRRWGAMDSSERRVGGFRENFRNGCY